MLKFAGLIVCVSLFVYLGVPWIYGRCLRFLLRFRAVRRKALVLTFDDGPGNRLTSAILKLLAENNVKATFFLLGRNIPGRERIVRQIAEQGHQIASHGYDHLHHWKVSPIRAIKDVTRGWQAIDTALGTKAGIYPFRPPYGKLNIVCLLYLLIHRVPLIYWTLDSSDTWSPRNKRDAQRAAISTGESGGAVVIAHDFDRENENDNIMVLDSLRATLLMAKKVGMRVITISELVGNEPRN